MTSSSDRGPVELPDGSVVVPAALAGSVKRILVRDLSQLVRRDGGGPTAGVRALVYALDRAEVRHEEHLAHQPGSDNGTPTDTCSKLEISTTEAAQTIGCSDSFVRRLCRSGALIARRAGGSRVWLVDAASLDTYRYRL